jgi:hypothetical protein
MFTYRTMNNPSGIISGGGWKDIRGQNVKIKAWSMLFLTIVLGGVAVTGPNGLALYACVLGGISLSLTVLFFFREKPAQFPPARSGSDLRKLQSTSTQSEQRR